MMTLFEIARQRLYNQRLSWSDLSSPSEVVKWLGAVQAQDYYGAKWAIAQRMRVCGSDNLVEKAFSDGSILRTHVMRPTWHFVSAADIRWLLRLTAPRVNAANAYYYRKFELDLDVFRRTNKALAGALSGGKQLSRSALRSVMQRAGVDVADPVRFVHILARAELDGVICSGARMGKQFTYALLEERVPQSRALGRDEALAELARRYFESHGPAMLQDFMWWSGLTAAQAKSGLEAIRPRVSSEVIDGKTYWFKSSNRATTKSVTALLLPTYDEYLVAYKNRTAVLPAGAEVMSENVVFSAAILLDGRVAGTWKRAFTNDKVVIAVNPLRKFTQAERRAITAAAQHYGSFLGMKAVVV